jgi:hypothetical protein
MKLLLHPLVRETPALIRRHARDTARPLVIELDPRGVTVRRKGAHDQYALSYERLFEVIQREHEQPLTVYAEQRALDVGCRG